MRWLLLPAETYSSIKAGDVWLNKVKYEGTKRIRGNVCLEVYLPSRGTCLLQHVNLGACDFVDIPGAFHYGMQELCDLHGRTGVGETGEYLPSTTDRQVGLGVLGLANLLRRYGVSYEQFGRALDQFNSGSRKSSVAYELAQINEGIEAAAEVARVNNMVRAFAIAPTASCSYRSQDALMGSLVLPRLHHLLLGPLTVIVAPLVSKHMIMEM
jgi:hypothetical protein